MNDTEWYLIGGLIAAGLVILILLFLLFRRPRGSDRLLQGPGGSDSDSVSVHFDARDVTSVPGEVPLEGTPEYVLTEAELRESTGRPRSQTFAEYGETQRMKNTFLQLY